MSNTNDQLSRRDQFLIESYKEQTAAWRHEMIYSIDLQLLPSRSLLPRWVCLMSRKMCLIC